MYPLLEKLRSDEFLTNLGFILPPNPMRGVYKRDPCVVDIANGLKDGTITEEDVRDFASSVRIKKGEHSIDDYSLAGLAVALEDIDADFAREFITDLAALKSAELVQSRHVAKAILRDKHLPPIRTMPATEKVIKRLWKTIAEDYKDADKDEVDKKNIDFGVNYKAIRLAAEEWNLKKGN